MTGPSIQGCDAFISYNHMEKLLAERLSRRIRRYRPPRSLGPELAKRRLVVFRDTERLTTKGELTDALLEHINAARNLLVLCSPEAAASRYVNDEIERFVARRGRDGTHIALAGGRSLECLPARAESAIQGATLRRLLAAARLVALAAPLSRRVATFDRGSARGRLRHAFSRGRAPKATPAFSGRSVGCDAGREPGQRLARAERAPGNLGAHTSADGVAGHAFVASARYRGQSRESGLGSVSRFGR